MSKRGAASEGETDEREQIDEKGQTSETDEEEQTDERQLTGEITAMHETTAEGSDETTGERNDAMTAEVSDEMTAEGSHERGERSRRETRDEQEGWTEEDLSKRKGTRTLWDRGKCRKIVGFIVRVIVNFVLSFML